MSLDDKLHMLTDADVSLIRQIAREVLGESPRGVPIPDDRPSIRARYRYAKLIEDCPSGNVEVLAKQTDKAGVPMVPAIVFKVCSWGTGAISGAKAGFHARYVWVAGSWDFDQSTECITPCDHSGTMEASLGDATVGESYADSITTEGIEEGSIEGSDLPEGLSMDSDGEITGTPAEGTEGVHYVIVTGDAQKTGPGDVTVGTLCSVTKAFKLVVKAAPETPP